MDSVVKLQPKTLFCLSFIQTCINVSFNWICMEGEKYFSKSIQQLLIDNWAHILDTYLSGTPQWMHAIENNAIVFDSETPLSIQTLKFLKFWKVDGDDSYCPFLPERCMFIFSYVHMQAEEVRYGDYELIVLEKKICKTCFCEKLSNKVLGRLVCSIKIITESMHKLLILRDIENYCGLCQATPLFSVLDVNDDHTDFYADMPVHRRRADGDVHGILNSCCNPLNYFRDNPVYYYDSKAQQYMSKRRASCSLSYAE